MAIICPYGANESSLNVPSVTGQVSYKMNDEPNAQKVVRFDAGWSLSFLNAVPHDGNWRMTEIVDIKDRIFASAPRPLDADQGLFSWVKCLECSINGVIQALDFLTLRIKASDPPDRVAVFINDFVMTALNRLERHLQNLPTLSGSIWSDSVGALSSDIHKKTAAFQKAVRQIVDASAALKESRPNRIRVRSEVDHAISDISDQISAVGGVISQNVPYTLIAFAARSHVRYVVREVLINAVKYRSERPLKIEICALRASGMISINISDNGIGVERQFLDKIFERKFRVPGVTGVGLGLGLQICTKVIEYNRGIIRALDNEVCGVTFEINLPVPPPSDNQR